MKKSTDDPAREWKPSELILERNNAFWVCNKSAGMPLHPDKTGDKSLLDLMEIYGKRKFYPVHRLDRPVSGVVILARQKTSAAALSELFKEGNIEKTYLAVCANAPDPVEGTIEGSLLADKRKYKAFLGDGTQEGEKHAALHYKMVGQSDRYHLLEIHPEEGRYHQIRALLASIGCPVKGDVKYGDRRGNRDRSIHLHAWKLSFPHPNTGEPLTFICPPPLTDPLWAVLYQGLTAGETEALTENKQS